MGRNSLLQKIADNIVRRANLDGDWFDISFPLYGKTIRAMGAIEVSSSINHDDGHIDIDNISGRITNLSIGTEKADDTDKMDVFIKMEDILMEN